MTRPTTSQRRSSRKASAPSRRSPSRPGERDLELTTALRRGIPLRRILENVDAADIDLIVIGTHGKTAPEEVKIASVSRRLVDAAPISVLLVRTPDDE